MKPIAVHVRVLNSLLFIKDAETTDLPKIDGIGALWATPSCVAVGCMPDCNGATEVLMADQLDLSAPAGELVFDSALETPSKQIVVETVLAQTVLSRTVPNARTRIRIWTNGHRGTDKIIVGLE